MEAAFEWFAEGEALDYAVVKAAPDSFDVNVTRCRYAEFYKKIGAPELGFLLVCSADFDMAQGFGGAGAPGVELTRTQTVMQGASHCDFRYTLKAPQRKD
jgi:hypothetical protein